MILIAAFLVVIIILCLVKTYLNDKDMQKDEDNHVDHFQPLIDELTLNK